MKPSRNYRQVRKGTGEKHEREAFVLLKWARGEG